MLTIKIEENPTEIIRELGIDCGANASVMTMRDGEALMGAGVFKIGDGYAEILDIRMKSGVEDFSLEYGIAKALLNSVDLKGIHHAVCNNEAISKLLCALRFENSHTSAKAPEELRQHTFYLNLTGYFDANC